jgi:transposase InsO family protein
MCKCLKVSRTAYYKWKHKQSKKKVVVSNTDRLRELIRELWEESHRLYGSPKITEMLKRRGECYSISYVARLMKEMGIKSMVKQKFVATTDSKHTYPVCENLLNREFEVTQLGKVWVSDITYIKCGQNWLYLTSVIDLADRKVVGWSLSRDMTTQNTVYRAWLNARRNREIADGFIFHSDRGVQYAAYQTANLFLSNEKATQSMSRKGNCWDNAVAESFFKTIKCELIHLYKWESFEQVFEAINKYIYWYNTKRLHQGIGYLTPLEKEQLLRNIIHKQAA